MEMHIASEEAMEALGETLGGRLAGAVAGSCSIFLRGPLGAGKTTLVRGFLRAMGYAGTIKSPTYTLIETYQLGDHEVHHFDLYRLNDPEELENIGVRDYFTGRSVHIVEWPEKGAGKLPPADIEFKISYDGTARQILIKAGSLAGQMLADSLK